MDTALLQAAFERSYSFVFMVGLTGYVPQLWNLIRTRRRAESISLTTWTVWLISWIISFGYGYFSLGDPKFLAVSGMNMLGHLAVIGLLVCYRRYAHPAHTTAL